MNADPCHYVVRFEAPTACGLQYGSPEYNRQVHHIASDWRFVNCKGCRESGQRSLGLVITKNTSHWEDR